jgi:hypothetical protein
MTAPLYPRREWSSALAKTRKSLLRGHLAQRADSLDRKNFRLPEGNTRQDS